MFNLVAQFWALTHDINLNRADLGSRVPCHPSLRLQSINLRFTKIQYNLIAGYRYLCLCLSPKWAMKWNNIIGKQNDQVCEIFRHFPKILQNSLALPIQPPEKQRQTTATTTPPMRPRPRNDDEFVERLREFAINIYPSRKYHDYVYPQHSLYYWETAAATKFGFI